MKVLRLFLHILQIINFISSFLSCQFYLDAIEVVRPLQSLSAEEFFPRADRYDGLRACIGESMCLELHKLRVFMVMSLQYLNIFLFSVNYLKIHVSVNHNVLFSRSAVVPLAVRC